MSDPFVGEIRMVGFNFAPTGWATCDGQLLPISRTPPCSPCWARITAGTGNPPSPSPTCGPSPIHWGQGPGLSDYALGESGGRKGHPPGQRRRVHSHVMTASGSQPSTLDPANMVLGSTTNAMYMPTGNTALDRGVLKAFGGGAPHNNRQPYLTMLFIIAMQGIFPQRP